MLTALNRSHELAAHVRGAVTNGATDGGDPGGAAAGHRLLRGPGRRWSRSASPRGCSTRSPRRGLSPAASEPRRTTSASSAWATWACRWSVGSRRPGYRSGLRRRRGTRAQVRRGVPTATIVERGREVAQGADGVVLMLPNSKIVGSVLVDEGLLDALDARHAPGRHELAPSRADPGDLGDDRASAASDLVDAPVSGGVRGARAGTLTIVMGGDPTPTSSRLAAAGGHGRPCAARRRRSGPGTRSRR